MRYVLGLDGGGTKTECVLMMNRTASFPPAVASINPMRVGFGGALAAVCEARAWRFRRENFPTRRLPHFAAGLPERVPESGDSSINTHSVFVPPPSRPKHSACKKHTRAGAHFGAAKAARVLKTSLRRAPNRIAFLTHRDAPTILDTLRKAARAGGEVRIHAHSFVGPGIVIVYLLGVTALGVYFRGKQRDVRDYF